MKAGITNEWSVYALPICSLAQRSSSTTPRLTLDEFQQLVSPFEAVFQAHMAAWRLDGKPRTARRFSVYENCPLPTPEDRLFFLLTYLKTYSLQVVQGRLFGMGQSKANQWIHVLLPALLAALRTLASNLLKSVKPSN